MRFIFFEIIPTLETLVKIYNILDVSADFLLELSDNLTFEMGGLTNEQINSVLQFISTIDKYGESLTKHLLKNTSFLCSNSVHLPK